MYAIGLAEAFVSKKRAECYQMASHCNTVLMWMIYGDEGDEVDFSEDEGRPLLRRQALGGCPFFAKRGRGMPLMMTFRLAQKAPRSLSMMGILMMMSTTSTATKATTNEASPPPKEASL
eukprot:NODE_5363_length_582_cov_59.688555_g4650_i0.p2 GENE.NODE_5363_length_582_cov_59.688555_g4650_i0~~NODE_5363_length_582_cov_59.688555_g4650_i0.p2  ORF type:complete len:119 (+),score=14.86 NODE_5363_length_582_cov_59.688555_g4650_i0:136-492(+)